MNKRHRTLFMLGALTMAACSGSSTTNDAAVSDVAPLDALSTDVAVSDAGASDAGANDARANDAAADVSSVDATAADVVGTDATAADVVGTDATAADVVGADATPRDVLGADAGDAPDPYACIGRVPPPMAAGSMSTLRLTARNFSSNAVMPGLTVKACARADTTCASPLSMGTTDGGGVVSLTVPLESSGFQGYFEFTGGAGAGAVTPTRTFFNPPITAVMPETSAILVPLATFTALGGALGATLDETRGAITFGVGHCLGAASGASVAVSPAATGATAFYNVTGLPDPRATQTDMGGQGGLLNVPPGEYTLTASRVSPMTRIGSVAVTVRGRFVTAVNVVPSP